MQESKDGFKQLLKALTGASIRLAMIAAIGFTADIPTGVM